VWIYLEMTINEAYKRVKNLDLRAQVPIIIELTSEELIMLNQAQLYTKSIDRDGEALGGYQSQFYEDLKKGMNPQLGGLVDLNLTGDFYGGFYVRVEDTEFIIGSTDEKSQELENKYGKDIFGITDDSRGEYIRTAFFIALKNYLQNITKFPFT
jgi:hypothetical protein